MFTFKHYKTYEVFKDSFEKADKLFEDGFEVEIAEGKRFTVKFEEDGRFTFDLERLNRDDQQSTISRIKSAMLVVDHYFRK